MKIIFSRLLVVLVSISILLTFSVVGCKSEATAGETTTSESMAVTNETTESSSAIDTTSENAGEKVELLWWTDWKEGQDFLNEVAKLFTEENPNINIKTELITTLGWEQNLVATFISGDEPDISYIQPNVATTLEQKYNPWLDFNKYGVKDWPEYSVMDPEAIESLTLNGELFGIETDRSWQGLFIRKSWMENVGWNKEYPYVKSWDDMVELAKKFTFEDPDKNGKDDTWGYEMFGSLSTNYALIQYQYMMAAAGESVIKNGKLNFNTEKGIATCQAMQDYIYKYKVAPIDTSTYTHVEFYRDVEGGILGMGRGAQWNVAPWDEALKGDYVIIPYPPIKEGPYGYQSAACTSLCVSKNTKHPEEAVKLCQFVLTKPIQEMMYKMLGWCIRNDLDFSTSNERAASFVTPNELVKLQFDTADPNWTPECKEILTLHIQNVLVDPNASPATEMKNAEDEISKIFYKE